MATLEERIKYIEDYVYGFASKEEFDQAEKRIDADGIQVWRDYSPSQFSPSANIELIEKQMGKIEGDIQNLGIYYVTKSELDEVNRKIGNLPEGKTNLVGYVDNLQKEVAALKAAASVIKIYKLPYTVAEFGAKLEKI